MENEGRMDEVEERPGIRMQIDVIAHDATARGSHTKLHRSRKTYHGWGQMNEEPSRRSAARPRSDFFVDRSAPES